MTRSYDKLFSVVLMVAVLAIAAAAVNQSFFANHPHVAGTGPTFVDGWEAGIDIGLPIGGPSTAPITLIVLSDLECPACSAFHDVLDLVLREHPTALRALYVPFPLEYHRFAAAAAEGAECAEQAGKFRNWIDVAYGKQDSLGVKPWTSYAFEAGIADTVQFRSCFEQHAGADRIESGRAYGTTIGLTGTPTILINGWRYDVPPSADLLRRVINELL